MKKLIIFYMCLTYQLNLSAQDLYAIYPINYPRTNSTIQKDGSTFYDKFNITISKEKDILYNGGVIFSCSFLEHYEYLIEVFEGTKKYLFVTPLPKIKGVASISSMDRDIMFLIDLKSGEKYYTSLNNIKRIEIPKAFEYGKNLSHVFMVKEIDDVNEELIMLQGGKEIKEVRVKMYKW